MDHRQKSYIPRAVVVLALGIASASPISLCADEVQARRSFGDVEFEAKSPYSQLRVRRRGNVRTLVFVRDTGEEVGETQMDIGRPHTLLVPYTQTMFSSYFFKPTPQRVMIVGLGGGAMTHFLKRYAPDVVVDAIEIDPIVIRIADKYFDTKNSDNIHIHEADGLKFIQETKNRYDVIYMDAFLKPSSSTDQVGLPLHLKTEEFYRNAKNKLNEGGVMVFNLNIHANVATDVQLLGRVFPQTYVFQPSATSYIVVGSTSAQRVNVVELRNRARKLDRNFRASFLFSRIVTTLKK